MACSNFKQLLAVPYLDSWTLQSCGSEGRRASCGTVRCRHHPTLRGVLTIKSPHLHLSLLIHRPALPVPFSSIPSKRDIELLLKLIANLNMLLRDENVNVVKKAILTMTQLYKVALQVSSAAGPSQPGWPSLQSKPCQGVEVKAELPRETLNFPLPAHTSSFCWVMACVASRGKHKLVISESAAVVRTDSKASNVWVHSFMYSTDIPQECPLSSPDRWFRGWPGPRF